MKASFVVVVGLLLLGFNASAQNRASRLPFPYIESDAGADEPPKVQACFLLYDLSAGEIRRTPSPACKRRVTPAATFDIPHALAGLDGSIVRAGQPLAGSGTHSLDTALMYSSTEYFQFIAQRLGETREREYMNRFNYGNADTSSGANFWMGGSLQISPDEQMLFLRRFFSEQLPVNKQAMADVRAGLRQPPGALIGNYGAIGIGRFPARNDTSVVAKSGSAVMAGVEAVRWQVGQITRGTRSFVFVSCVTGPLNLPEGAAATFAANELRAASAL